MTRNKVPGLTYRELNRADWPLVEELFGRKGACGGCWCMHWRTPTGAKLWEKNKGEPNQKAFRKLVSSGQAHGILALEGPAPVGWCSFGLKSEFPRINNSKAYQLSEQSPATDPNTLWCINCFYIAPGYRWAGVATGMAKAAINAIRDRGGKVVEAYPTPLTKAGKRLPAAFSFTGPERLFEKLKFVEVQHLSHSRPLYRRKLRAGRSKTG